MGRRVLAGSRAEGGESWASGSALAGRAVSAAGVGVGWVSIIDPARVTAMLDVAAQWELVAYLCVGYPQDPSDMPELQRRGWEHRDPERQQWIDR